MKFSQKLVFAIAAPLAMSSAAVAPVAVANVGAVESNVAMRLFMGRTESIGTLKKALQSPVKLRTLGTGRMAGDTLMLDHVITEAGKPQRTRNWRFRQAQGNQWTGSVSDGVGPLTATLNGNRLSIRYKMKGGLLVRQSIDIAPDARSASNRTKVTKLGVQVGSYEETIRKVD